jgi:hypothetical protein
MKTKTLLPSPYSYNIKFKYYPLICAHIYRVFSTLEDVLLIVYMSITRGVQPLRTICLFDYVYKCHHMLRIYIHTHVHTHTHIHTHTYTRIHTHTYIHTHKYTYTQYVRTHTHTHTCIPKSENNNLVASVQFLKT